MAIKVLETVYVYDADAGGIDGGIKGSVTVKIDTEANAGSGSIIVTANHSVTNVIYSSNRVRPVGDEYPNSPFFSTVGKKLVVKVADPTVFATITATDVVCDIANLKVSISHATRDDNGQIAVSASGTNGTKEFSINGGQTWQLSPNFYNLAPGIYEVVAADAERSCSVSQEVTVLNKIARPNDVQIVDIDVTNETGTELGDGSIAVTASGSNTPLYYSLWYGNNPVTIESQSSLFVDLPPGTYKVRVVDSENNYADRDNIVVLPFAGEPDEPIIPQRITEIKTVEIRDCEYGSPFFVSWLNILGGWDSWLFDRKQTYELEVSDMETYAPGYSDLSMLKGNLSTLRMKAKQVVTVGCEGELNSNIKGLAEIILSEKIYWYRDKANWNDRIEILPVPGSVNMSGHKIELSFALPDYYL